MTAELSLFHVSLPKWLVSTGVFSVFCKLKLLIILLTIRLSTCGDLNLADFVFINLDISWGKITKGRCRAT